MRLGPSLQNVSRVLLMLLMLVKGIEAAAAGASYPAPMGGDAMRARGIALSINGDPAFVYDLMPRGVTYGGIPTVSSAFASFELPESGAKVTIAYPGIPVHAIRVRRLGVSVPVQFVENKVTFRIDKPGAYEVVVNYDLYQRGPVIIFANAPENLAPRPGDIVFRPGVITDAGIIQVRKPRQRIFIPGGAIVRGIIKVQGTDGVTISGHGILLFDDAIAKSPELRNDSDTNPILVTDARHLTLEGVTIVVGLTSFSGASGGGPEAPWAIHILRSSDVRISDVNILNNLRDGLDIDGSERVSVKGGLIQTHDDGLCIKSANYGPGGGSLNRTVTDVVFDGLMIANTGAGSALAIGTELHAAEISHITFRDIDVLHAIGRHSAAISIRNGDRAWVHDILYDNVRVLDLSGKLLRLSVETDGYRPDPERGKISGIIFRELKYPDGKGALSSIEGIDEIHTIREVTFKNSGSDRKPVIQYRNAPAAN